MNSLWNDLIQCQNRNEEYILKIMEKFDPLLKKYANKLGGEDAYYDLKATFFELIVSGKIVKYINNKDEFYLLGYIRKSVLNEFFRLLREKHQIQKAIPFSSFGENEESIENYIQKKDFSKYEFEELDFPMIKSVLTTYEYQVIIQYYIIGYQVKEIAKNYGVSSSAITQTKNRALKKLRKLY